MAELGKAHKNWLNWLVSPTAYKPVETPTAYKSPYSQVFRRIDRELSSKRISLLRVTKASKQKDAAGLDALAYAYGEGDQSMLDCVPDRRMLKIVSEALQRPRDFFRWVVNESRGQRSTDIILSAQRYLPAATWQWDKACILAGALLATKGDTPMIEPAETPSGEFPYWVALDKHTPQGKVALTDVAKQVKTSYRRLIWASFYYESARINRLLPSPWWDAEKMWRLRRAGLSLDAAKGLWALAGPLVRQRLEDECAALRAFVEAVTPPDPVPIENRLL